ncbi:ATP-binding protein [Streptomyces sp. 21So2-11]|uniref:ATP-binding protein n=1 Tax=Streptomyces sp. 21So2-11 TaxID=3144408 RepID=UPI00321A6EA1
MHLHPASAFRRPVLPLPAEAPDLAAVDRVEYADHAVWHLPASPKAATVARHLVLACLSRWQCAAEAVDTVALLVTELVTNAVQHGAAPILLRLDREGDAALTVAVHDAGTLPLTPSARAVSPSAEHGRGLRLVEALADAFALSSGGRGTLVVARLDRPGEEAVRPPGVASPTP